MIIVSACDLKYKKYMDSLVASVLKNTQYQIRVHFLPPGKCSGYYANYRVEMISELIHSQPENVLWLDADTIVRGDISEIDSILEVYDTAAVDTSKEFNEECNQWLISSVGIANSERGRMFCEIWKQKLMAIHAEPGAVNTIMDCQTAYVRMLRGSNEWKVFDLTYKYSDKHMNPNSPIWEAQGNRKKTEKWLNEMETYASRLDQVKDTI